jgi:hypothetical protein
MVLFERQKDHKNFKTLISCYPRDILRTQPPRIVRETCICKIQQGPKIKYPNQTFIQMEKPYSMI